MYDRPTLTSLSNPLVKKVRSLHQRKSRTDETLFLAEGIHHVGSALEAGWDLEALLFAPELLRSEYALTLLSRAANRGVQPQPVSAKVMESLTEKDNPQGILAVVKQRKAQLSDLQVFQRGVALVSPQDPGNVGAILRTLDAVNADGLFLLEGGVDLYHPTCVRASMGAIFWKPVIQASFIDFVDWANSAGIRLVATSAHAKNDYREVELGSAPWVLVLGSEQKGLSEAQMAACDLAVSMPMRGRVSSLNLAVAAGILLYTLNK